MPIESILARLTTAVLLVDESGHVTFRNQSCVSLLPDQPHTFESLCPGEHWCDIRPNSESVVKKLRFHGPDDFVLQAAIRATDNTLSTFLIELTEVLSEDPTFDEVEIKNARGLLNESESLLRGFSVEWDIQSDTYRVSRNFFSLTGKQPPPCTTDVRFQLRSVIPKEELAEVRDCFMQARLKAKSFTITHKLTCRDGTVRNMVTVGKPLIDENNVVYKVISVTIDTTEVIKSQEALKQSEAKFRAFMESFPGSVFIKDANHVYRYSTASSEFRQKSYYDQRTFEGKSVQEIFPPAMAGRLVAREDEILKSLRPKDIKDTYAHPDGKVRHLQGRIFPIKSGEEVLLGGYFIDETEQFIRDEEKDLLMSAIEDSGEVVIITDNERKIRYVNPAFEEIFGYAREDVVGISDRPWRTPENDPALVRESREKVRQEGTWKGILVNRRKDGRLLQVETTLSKVRDKDGNIAGYIAIKRDVTQQKELEQALLQSRKMESIGTLAGGIAHDHNNALQTILGSAEELIDALKDRPEVMALAQDIRSAARHSSTLTSQLLAFARKQVTERRTINVNEEVKSMQMMLQRSIGSNIQLAFKPDEKLWNTYIDPNQLRQVLTNIIVNSRDAINDVGEIIIRTCNVPADQAAGLDRQIGISDDTDYIRLDIVDNGTGMDEAISNRIFEPFYSTKSMDEGTGLGLSTVYGIIKQNNGYIICQSQAGEGTTMSLLLPRDSGEVMASTSNTTTQASVPDKRILVVDDEAAVLKLIERSLARTGYEVTPVDEPQKAIDLLASGNQFDLLLTDIIMPSMNGLDLAKAIKEQQPDIHVLFMSGYSADVLERIESEEEFIQKPFGIGELLEHVARVLSAKADTQQPRVPDPPA